jgi:hypothetical protein
MPEFNAVKPSGNKTAPAIADAVVVTVAAATTTVVAIGNLTVVDMSRDL